MHARALIPALLAGLAACGSAAKDHAPFTGQWEHGADVTLTRDLALPPGAALHAAVDAGGVVVRAGATNEARVRARVTVHATDARRARALAEAATLVVEPLPDDEPGLSVGVDLAEDDQPVLTRVDLELLVPAGTSVLAATEAGDVLLDGGAVGLGPCAAESAAGEVQVVGARGGASLRALSGRALATGCEGGVVEVFAGDGGARVEGVTAAEVRARTSSGDVALSDVHAARVLVESDTGDADLREVFGAVEVRCSSGEIALADAAVEPADLRAGYGPVRVARVAGDVLATSTSGPIVLEQVSGAVDLDCGYGAVRVDGILTGLAARTSTGDVRVRAERGSRLPEAGWSLRTDLGNVRLVLPADLGAALDLRANGGELDCALPLAIEAGAASSWGRLRGDLAGGGPPLRVETDGGDVRVRPLDETP